jgi:hypothetical protein
MANSCKGCHDKSQNGGILLAPGDGLVRGFLPIDRQCEKLLPAVQAEGRLQDMLDEFISERLLDKVIEVYFGTGKADRLKGKVMESSNGVLVLEYNGRRDYINLDKVLALWEA